MSCASLSLRKVALAWKTRSGDTREFFSSDKSLAGLAMGPQGSRRNRYRDNYGVQMTLTRPPANQVDEEIMMEGTLQNISQVVTNMPDVFPIRLDDGSIVRAVGEAGQNVRHTQNGQVGGQGNGHVPPHVPPHGFVPPIPPVPVPPVPPPGMMPPTPHAQQHHAQQH